VLGELIRDASLQQCIEPVDRVVGNVGEDEAQIRFGVGGDNDYVRCSDIHLGR